MIYYIYYEATSKINYIYLLYLYGVAQYNKETKHSDLIEYKTLEDLADRINKRFKDQESRSKYNGVSASSLSKILNNKDYENYLFYDKENKKIIIKNNFKQSEIKRSFITLTEKEFILLTTEKDLLLCRYLFYLKYFIGFSKNKMIDTTAKQFLSALGYSITSGSNLTLISYFNNLLQEKEIIKI